MEMEKEKEKNKQSFGRQIGNEQSFPKFPEVL